MIYSARTLLAFFFLAVFSLRAEPENETESPHFWIPEGKGGVDQLSLKENDVRIRIVGTLAQVEVTQVYANVGTKPIEAMYVFPGSTRAAVHGLEMRVGDRLVKAQIKKKAEARATYESAKKAGKTASLLEQHRPNVFQMNLANILPGDLVEVTLRYSEWLTLEKGEYSFVYPTVVGPRYGGKGSSLVFKDKWVANPYLEEGVSGGVSYSLSLKLAAGVSLERVLCPTHNVKIDYEDESTALIELIGSKTDAGNRDFILNYQVSGDELKSGLLLSESNGEKYFFAMLQPPVPSNRVRMPREYFFIVDVSGSMRGFPLDTAKRVMSELVAKLEVTDRFNLMLFAGESAVLSERSLEANQANFKKALLFLDTRHGGGGTELLPAMLKAYATPRDEAFSRNIVILTDGYVGVEEEAFEIVRSRLNEANLFSIGIGSSVNRFLIEGLARVGQGEPFFVTNANDSRKVAQRFSEYVSEPILSQILVEFENFDVYDVEPPALPDLLADRPVYLFGKWRGDREGAKIKLSGRSGDSEYVEEINVASASNMVADRVLEFVWARERIQRLSDYNELWSKGERVEEVTELGLKHALLTKYTSFVAVDEVVRRKEGEGSIEVTQPLPLPMGVTGAALGGGTSVPVTPEPEMWALMGCVFAALIWMGVRRTLCV